MLWPSLEPHCTNTMEFVILSNGLHVLLWAPSPSKVIFLIHFLKNVIFLGWEVDGVHLLGDVLSCEAAYSSLKRSRIRWMSVGWKR